MSRTPKEVSLGLLSAGGSSGNEIDIQAEDLDDLLRQLDSSLVALARIQGVYCAPR